MRKVKYMKVKGIIERRIGDSIILIKEENKKVYYLILNKTASFIWKRIFSLDYDKLCKEIISKFYGIKIKEAKKEVKRIINKLIKENFISVRNNN